MISSASIPPVVFASIAGFIGFYALWVSYRRGWKHLELSFGLSCLAIAVYDVFCAGLYNATSVEQGVVWQRLQLGSLSVVTALLIWYLGEYTERLSRPCLTAFALFAAGHLIAVIVDPGDWLWRVQEPHVSQVVLPWGGEVTYHEAGPGPLGYVHSVSAFIFLFYSFRMTVGYLRGSGGRRGLGLLLALACFTLGFTNDILIAIGVIDSIYLLEYAYIGMILLMSYMMSRDLVAAAIMRRERAELAERLRQAQKMEAVGRLAGGIAHDLNNMLTPIIGYAEIALRKDREPEQNRVFFEQIRDAAEHARVLTRQLLAFGRKQILRMKVLSPNLVIRRAEPMIRRLIREDVAIVFTLDDDVGNVSADETQLQQILINLAVNARDAMPGGGRMFVSTERVDVGDDTVVRHRQLSEGRYVRLSVRDTGRGMDERTVSQVFEPFFTTKDLGQGTGLGLSTVYGIVRQHGGHIMVDSEPGVGSTFHVYLPHVAEGAAPPTDEPPEVLDRSISGTERILVVEDERAVGEMASEVLGSHGYAVENASDADRALAAAGPGGEAFDLLLTDVIMPGTNGRELFEKLSRRNPGLRVLYMSGYAGDVIARHGILDEDVDFIEKPFSPRALLSAVRAALDRPAGE